MIARKNKQVKTKDETQVIKFLQFFFVNRNAKVLDF